MTNRFKILVLPLNWRENFLTKYFWQGEGIPQTGVYERTFEWTTGRLSVGDLSFIKLLN